MQSSDSKHDGSDEITDWSATVERALAGDVAAYGALTSLVTGYLLRWRAFDFEAEWDDIVQDVLVTTIAAHSEGRFNSAAAFQSYVRQATRFKFIDRIRRLGRRGRNYDPAELHDSTSGDSDGGWPPRVSVRSRSAEIQISVRRAVDGLEEKERLAVLEVYVRGRTYAEAAATTGIPLGSLKRALKNGMARLRQTLDGESGA